MNMQTLKEQIEKLFGDEYISFYFKTYKNGKEEMCISWSCDPTGGNQHDFEYYVSFSSVQELIVGLSEIDPDDVVATEYDIRTDPDFNNDYEFDEDEKSEIKYVCEKWGETLHHVIQKIVEGLTESFNNEDLIELKQSEYTITKDEDGTEMDAPGYELMFISCAADQDEGDDVIVETFDNLNDHDIDFSGQSLLQLFGATHFVIIEPKPGWYGDTYYFRKK